MNLKARTDSAGIHVNEHEDNGYTPLNLKVLHVLNV